MAATDHTTVTDADLDAVWCRAGQAEDMTMVDLVERALDGDDTSRRIVARSVRDVEIYRVAVATARALARPHDRGDASAAPSRNPAISLGITRPRVLYPA